MESLESIIGQQQQDRPAHDDPLVEKLFAMIVRLGEENCVLRDRLDTCYQLASEGNVADSGAVDAFVADDELLAKRAAAHREFFEELFAGLN